MATGIQNLGCNATFHSAAHHRGNMFTSNTHSPEQKTKKTKNQLKPKQATLLKCKCRRTPPSFHYLRRRHILNSLQIPAKQKNRSKAEPHLDLHKEQLNKIRSNKHRSFAGARAQRDKDKSESNRIENQKTKINYSHSPIPRN